MDWINFQQDGSDIYIANIPKIENYTRKNSLFVILCKTWDTTHISLKCVIGLQVGEAVVQAAKPRGCIMPLIFGIGV